MAFTVRRHREQVLGAANRTSSTVIGPFEQKRFRGVIVYLRMNSIGGGGTLGVKVILRAKDTDGNSYDLNDGGTALAAAPNQRLYILYPSTLDAAAGFIAETIQLPLPEKFDVLVYHLDAGTYNYQVELEYLE
jgi:hypothetical protein